MTKESMPPATQASRPRLVRRVNSRPVSRESSVDVGSVGAQNQGPTVVPRRVSTISGRGIGSNTRFKALTRRVVKSTTNVEKQKTPPPDLVDLTVQLLF